MGELMVRGGGVGETGWEISPDVRSPEVGIPTSSYRSKTKSTTYYILLHPFSSQQCALFPLSLACKQALPLKMARGRNIRAW